MKGKWSLKSVREYLVRLIDERDRQCLQRFTEQEKALAAALLTQEKALAAAFAAQVNAATDTDKTNARYMEPPKDVVTTHFKYEHTQVI